MIVITHILREINFEHSRIAKSVILTHLEAVNCDFSKMANNHSFKPAKFSNTDFT